MQVNKVNDESVLMLTDFYDGEKLPFELGSAEKEAFHELGKWKILGDEDGTIAYKIGVKRDVPHDSEEPITLIIFFVTLTVPGGQVMTEAQQFKLSSKFERFMTQDMIRMRDRFPNVSGIDLPPTPEMLDDLKKVLAADTETVPCLNDLKLRMLEAGTPKRDDIA